MLKELIIKIDNQNIHLSPKLTVPIHHTNIPYEHCEFRSHRDIFWKVELLEYNKDNKCWKMKVVDYSANDINNFDRQKSTKEVERIAFEKFNWIELERLLTNYHKIKLLNVLNNHDTNRFYREEQKQKTDLAFSVADFSHQINEVNLSQTQYKAISFVPNEREPIIETLKVMFDVYFSDASFKLGYVTFSKIIKEIGDKLDFKIKNDHILAEFDNIKSWFAKKLKTKKFRVNAIIITTDSKVTEVTATSQEISMIDTELIDSIKYQRTIALTKSLRIIDTDKSLFTAEEIFGELDTDEIEGNVFSQNELDIFGFLLDNHKTRNRKQLEYLSGYKQAENSKLRFTLHPNFGFLFFVEGKDNNHFIWELLNSNSTYIWSIDKSEMAIELQYKRIEDSVNFIRDSGREEYKRAYRQNHHDSDLVFCEIKHDDITSNFVDGFVKWKHKLNEKIT